MKFNIKNAINMINQSKFHFSNISKFLTIFLCQKLLIFYYYSTFNILII